MTAVPENIDFPVLPWIIEILEQSIELGKNTAINFNEIVDLIESMKARFVTLSSDDQCEALVYLLGAASNKGLYG